MNILYVIAQYGVGNGATWALSEFLIGSDNKLDARAIITSSITSTSDDRNVYEVSSPEEICSIIKKIDCDIVHYVKSVYSHIFEMTIEAIHRIGKNIPVITTVVQCPSSSHLLLSPVEIRHTTHFVFIDKTSFDLKLLSFLPIERRSQIYLLTRKYLEKTKAIPFKENNGGPIIYGRGSTLNKCPRNMFKVFDKIDVPKKEFHIVGIPEGDNWVRKEAKRRSNVKVYPQLPYEEWFELCKDFDVSLYQLPKKAYSSIDANMGLPMLMQKPTVYYGPLAPKERMIHGENGFVATTSKEISEYATMLGENSLLRKRMGIKAREMSLEMRYGGKGIQEYHKIYEQLILTQQPKPIKIPCYYKLQYICKCFREIMLTYIYHHQDNVMIRYIKRIVRKYGT